MVGEFFWLNVFSRPLRIFGLLLLVVGCVFLVFVGWVAYLDISVWGKDVAAIFFGTRVGEFLSLGLDLRLVYYAVIGAAMIVSSFLVFLYSIGKLLLGLVSLGVISVVLFFLPFDGNVVLLTGLFVGFFGLASFLIGAVEVEIITEEAESGIEPTFLKSSKSGVLALALDNLGGIRGESMGMVGFGSSGFVEVFDDPLLVDQIRKEFLPRLAEYRKDLLFMSDFVNSLEKLQNVVGSLEPGEKLPVKLSAKNPDRRVRAIPIENWFPTKNILNIEESKEQN